MLVLVDFDSLTDRARSDKLFDVLPKAWPDVFGQKVFVLLARQEGSKKFMVVG